MKLVIILGILAVALLTYSLLSIASEADDESERLIRELMPEWKEKNDQQKYS